MKTAIVVLADPTGGDEALGRAFNALAAAKDFAAQAQAVTVLLQGAGSRWSGVLADATHPLPGLYTAVRHHVAGASDACATFFDAREGVAAAGLEFVTQHQIDGVGGLPSLAALTADGWSVVTF